MEDVVGLDGPTKAYLAALWDVKGSWNWRQNGRRHTPRVIFATKQEALAHWVAHHSCDIRSEQVGVPQINGLYTITLQGARLQWLLRVILPYLKFRRQDAQVMQEWGDEETPDDREAYYTSWVA